MKFNFFYKTAPGHGRRGPDVEAETIEEAFEIAKTNNPLIWPKAIGKEFYVTPEKLPDPKIKNKWNWPEKYPRYTTYGIVDGRGVELYESKFLKN